MKFLLALIFTGLVAFAQEKTGAKADATANTKEVKETKELPTARAVIDRYVTALGGREAFLKHKSLKLEGKTDVAGQGIQGTLTLATAFPDKMLLTINLAGISVKSGFDGKVGWSVNPLLGPSLVEGKALDQLKRQADFYAILHEPDRFASMTNLGKVNFEGEECYKLQLKYKDGGEATEFYSVETGLQKGQVATEQSEFGAITVTGVNLEHKKFGDIMMPSKVTQKMSGIGQTMTIDTVEFDTVPPETFDLPAEIKALLEAPEPAPADKKEDAPVEKPAPAK